MNDKIFDLAEQSIVKYAGADEWVFTSEELQAFAKSIIQKTIDCCNDEILSQHHLGNVCCQDSADVIKSRIKDYFGVK